MAPPTSKDRRQIFDGERLREVWTPADGPGDGDIDLITSGHSRPGGHRTWKIFADDLEDGVQRIGNQPPPRVYLDDKACYEVLTAGIFSANHLGKCWPYDFTQVGKLRAGRPNRGRPARLEDGKIATGYRSKSVYYFYGASGGQSKKRKLSHFENDSNGQDAGREDAGSASPGPMDIVRMDEENYNRAREAIQSGENDIADASEEAHAPTEAPKTYRLNQDLLDKTLDELDKAELEELRQEYVKAAEEAEQAHVYGAQQHHEANRAQHEQIAIAKDRDRLLKKHQDALKRLDTEHRECCDLKLALKRYNTEALVTKVMLEKTRQELQALKNERTVDKIRAEGDHNEAFAKLRQENEALSELCKTLYVGHKSLKAIVDDIRQESSEDLPDSLKPFDDIQQVVEDGIEAIKNNVQERGIGDILNTIISNDNLVAREDTEASHSDS